MSAAGHDHELVVEVLVNAGASLDIQDKVGIVYKVLNHVTLVWSEALYVSPALSI